MKYLVAIKTSKDRSTVWQFTSKKARTEFIKRVKESWPKVEYATSEAKADK